MLTGLSGGNRGGRGGTGRWRSYRGGGGGFRGGRGDFRGCGRIIKIILDTFREETQIKKAVEVPITTRSGRLVKKPQKLDL